MSGLVVRDAMTRDVVTVPDSATVGAAVDRVLGRGHTHVVVVDAHGALRDIVSAHLLTTALMTRLVERQQPVLTVLAEPVTARPGTGLGDAAALMLERAADALGVVDRRGRLVGILTWADIGRSVVRPATGRAGRPGRTASTAVTSGPDPAGPVPRRWEEHQRRQDREE